MLSSRVSRTALLTLLLIGCPLLRSQEPARAGRPAETVRPRPRPKPPSNKVDNGSLIPKKPAKPNEGISLKQSTLADHDKKIHLSRPADTSAEAKTSTLANPDKKFHVPRPADTSAEGKMEKDEHGHHHGDVGCDSLKNATAKKKCEEEEKARHLKQNGPK